jgi:hypothetical protein
VYAWALLEAGHEEHASSVLASVRAQSTADTQIEAPDVLLQCARLAARQGRDADAARDLQDGLASARAIGLPYEQALLLEECARLHATEGGPDRAQESLAQAIAIFNRLGAVPDTERATRALDALNANHDAAARLAPR